MIQLKIVWYLASLFIVVIVFLQTPKESAGLISFETQTNILGSPSSTRQLVNTLIGITVCMYFIIAIKFNFVSLYIPVY